jgi:branched-chain amino acid transport system substrate-binding protein
MTQRRRSRPFVRLKSKSAQCAYALAEYSATELKYKKIVTIADDFGY